MPAAEQSVVRGAGEDVLEHARLFAHGDTGAGGDVAVKIDATLRVEVAVPAAALAVRHRPRRHQLGDALDDAIASAVLAAASWP